MQEIFLKIWSVFTSNQINLLIQYIQVECVILFFIGFIFFAYVIHDISRCCPINYKDSQPILAKYNFR